MPSTTDAAAPTPSAPTPPTPSAPTPPSLMATWGNISFSAPPSGVRVREMMIPDVVRDAARTLIDAIDTARGDRVVALDIGAGDRAWPREVPRTPENADYLRLAIRREIERRGYKSTSGTPADGVWQVSAIYGRDTVGWRFRVVAPRRAAARQ